ncbi:hypothetical protein H4S02_004759 [Coemansia sp. RSA 2611]|uniref:Uncharacterized protein n=1 Tax=Coemansia linderi TaxID=2663919 RepID=A0ACC1KC68_9FUNG|nr:hypothetical protein LPJ60_001904 [Coemansia sp. RSA 2675]KAJ2384555.1 hypothetical protein H4S02_004759 [Coemansia sp. RSA 2611]KAJ2408103.1 hypothetical protein GGI10_004896 [Coemansia sp. RSA 2530]KAJ2692439.1 hypothetical protein H4218_006345 [Coemansia sp. IMI 209128]KAJ2785810.1 hypothetical protein GGI18_003322 [Coemansia linderi]
MPKDKTSSARSTKIDSKKKRLPLVKPPSKKSEIDDIFAAKKKPLPDTSESKHEIDDIFATKGKPQAAPKALEPTPAAAAAAATPAPAKTKKTKPVTVVDATAASTTSVQQQQPRRPPKSDDFADSRGKSSKYTEDGLRVFYMEDLRIGEGEGATELCPFDCTCCF